MFSVKVNQTQQLPQQIGNQYPPMEPKTTPITEEYDISNTVLGLGINGKVVKCTNKLSGNSYALKVNQIVPYFVA